MKKLRHPHVVRLYEVIDDRMKEKIYMSMSSLVSFVSGCRIAPLLCYFSPCVLFADDFFICASHGISRRRRSQVAGPQKPTGPYYFSNSKNLTRCCSRARISCVICQPVISLPSSGFIPRVLFQYIIRVLSTEISNPRTFCGQKTVAKSRSVTLASPIFPMRNVSLLQVERMFNAILLILCSLTILV